MPHISPLNVRPTADDSGMAWLFITSIRPQANVWSKSHCEPVAMAHRSRTMGMEKRERTKGADRPLQPVKASAEPRSAALEGRARPVLRSLMGVPPVA